jgi:transposase-like protein
VTVCPVCFSQNQSVVVGPRVRGTCYDCGTRWDRERDQVRIVALGQIPEEAAQTTVQQA